MSTEARIRSGKRQDTPGLTNLRIEYLAEVARLEPRLQLLPDVRERTEHALPVWIDQDERVLLVAELRRTEDGHGPLAGYATGVSVIWPPVFLNQHVGEVSEVYVLPEHRGRGFGRELLSTLTQLLREKGAQVLRAPVPMRNEDSLGRFLSLGYRPLHYVLQKGLEDD